MTTEQGERAKGRLAGHVPYAIVLVGVLGGLFASWQNFRLGAYIMAASMLCAAAFRAFLPEERLGFLVTRKRVTDITVMALLGLGLALFAWTAPGG
ncbi:DUF3017 domain-containing protein [Actinocorallia populi]|uniref:DUF3017 domain-containing protein n=1 Tax=Actinocorallia populi TaxID=2079200 RepID=UPI000D09737B|nr:DUF3017 domain-containing protein [Actinocorallia populi]